MHIELQSPAQNNEQRSALDAFFGALFFDPSSWARSQQLQIIGRRCQPCGVIEPEPDPPDSAAPSEHELEPNHLASPFSLRQGLLASRAQTGPVQYRWARAFEARRLGFSWRLGDRHLYLDFERFFKANKGSSSLGLWRHSLTNSDPRSVVGVGRWALCGYVCRQEAL